MANGGIRGKVNSVASDGASGVFDLEEVYLSVLGDNWPGTILPLNVDFLVIGGGGGSTGYSNYLMTGGGGAGGYLNSYGSDSSGGNSASLSTLVLAASTNYTVTVGAGGAAGHNDGADSVFSGTDKFGSNFNHTAGGGGAGGGTAGVNAGGNNGGSAGGASYLVVETNPPSFTTYSGGTATANQGSNGGDAGGTATGPQSAYWCSIYQSVAWCITTATYGGGGGGGAGGAGSAGSDSGGGNGGDGLATAITGGMVTRAGGGAGTGRTGSDGVTVTNGSPGAGQNNAGGGANAGASASAGNDGTVILRYPTLYTISFDSNYLTGTTQTVGTDSVTTFTAGSGTISFT